MIKIYLFVLFIISTAVSQQTSCDFELILAKNAMSKYLSQSYSPPEVDLLWSCLNEIKATVEAIYILCFNKPGVVIIDPYTPNSANCLINLNKTALMGNICQTHL